MKSMKKFNLSGVVKVLAYANLCTFAIAICNVATGFCIPGLAYEPKMSLEMLEEE